MPFIHPLVSTMGIRLEFIDQGRNCACLFVIYTRELLLGLLKRRSQLNRIYHAKRCPRLFDLKIAERDGWGGFDFGATECDN